MNSLPIKVELNEELPEAPAYNRNNKFIASYCSNIQKITGGNNKKINWYAIRINASKIHRGEITDFKIFKKNNNNEKKQPEIHYTSNSSDSDVKKIINSNIDFWNVINRIRYYDKDESFMNKNSITLSDNKKLFVRHKINSTFIPIMKNILLETAVMGSINIRDINNFITHIIFKGKIFYTAILNEPELSMYLCTQFYPIYDWLMGR